MSNNPYAIKMKSNELQMYLHFKKRGYKVKAKKGKGAEYDRNIFKNKKEW